MDAMGPLWTWALGIGLMAGAERLVVRAVRGALLAVNPVSGDHTDAAVYHRNLTALSERDMQLVALALVASGVSMAAAWHFAAWPVWPSLLLWAAALGWDLWTWERAAGSVKFVSWRRGWKQSVRRAAVSDLQEVNVTVRRHEKPPLPAWLLPPSCYLTLIMRNGQAVRLPRTGAWLGGEAQIENLANFVRLQIEVVADNRRRAAADKRSEARRAALPVEPMHPSTKVDPLAINRGN